MKNIDRRSVLAATAASAALVLSQGVQAQGAPIDSWNELLLTGQVSFDDEIKQIAALRRAL